MESNLITDKYFLLCIGEPYENMVDEFNYVKNNFCGITIDNEEDIKNLDIIDNTKLYLCGDINRILSNIVNNKVQLYLIENLSWNYEMDMDKFSQIINSGKVPINIHNVGVFFRNFFDSSINYFTQINNEHQFQTLKASTKSSESYRKGLLLTQVTEHDDETYFNLLRCSTNLDGPTDNFKNTDHLIVDEVNSVCDDIFEEHPKLNHVLTQVYFNTKVENKSKKAKIKEHSDKTKDMPKNGLMAFCTFYDNLDNMNKSKSDLYDYVYKNTSVLTVLRFRLKDEVSDNFLVKKFDIILYPNSVFMNCFGFRTFNNIT